MRHRLKLPLVLCCLLPGCYATYSRPVVPVPLRLVSPSGFQIVQAADPPAVGSSCVALQAEFQTTSLRGDTLHFAQTSILRQPPGALPCAHSGAGLVVLASHPDIQSERLEVHRERTWAAAIVAIPLMLGLSFVVALLTSR